MTTIDLMEGLIERREAARQLKCNDRTLARYENLPDGLPSITIAGRKYYRIAALREFLERRERRPNPTRGRA